MEAGSTRKGGCLRHAKVQNSFLLPIFQTQHALLGEKLETSRLNSGPDRPMFTQFSLLPHRPGLLANVLYINLGDAS